MDHLGIEMLSVFGMPPIEFVQLVADLGCRYITTGMVGFAPLKALDYQPYSLRDDSRLRQDLLAVMDDHDVSISLGEGLLIAPGVDVRSYADDLDIMAELQIPRINTVSLEPDRARTFDELATLTALAAERGIATCVEPVVGLSIADLPSALAAVEYVGRDEISLLIAPGVDVRSYADDLDIMAELRIPRINTVSLEPDRGRTFDELAALTALAAERGIATCVEPVVGLSIADLPSALAAVEYVDRDEISLLIDTMHVARFGATADDLWSVPAQRIGYIQLSDTTLQPRLKIYAEEAMYERMTPGEGELPLADMLAALPDDRVVGLEVPMRSRAEAGASAYDRLLPCVNSARALLAGARETR